MACEYKKSGSDDCSARIMMKKWYPSQQFHSFEDFYCNSENSFKDCSVYIEKIDDPGGVVRKLATELGKSMKKKKK